MRMNQSEVRVKLLETKNTLAQLKHPYALEKFAREEKFFKKENEDVFVITYE